MKYRTQLLTLSALLLVLVCGGFQWLKEICAAPVPVPSHPGGYYAEPFRLELTVPARGSIYYTTDGSTPTRESQLYRDGIWLEDRSSQPNVYSEIRNVVDWKNYTPDPTPVPKGTVIRALFVNELGLESDIATQTYFVGIPEPERGYTLSLIFEQDNLFGDDGIYVTGKEFDHWLHNTDQSSPAPVPNYQKRLETTAIAEILDERGDVVNQPVSLRLQGSSARGLIKKRFILEASADLTGTNLFPAEIFPGVSTHSLMTKEFPSDALIADLISDRSVASQKSAWVQLYLNGEYWQKCYFLERYDNQYFRQYYDVDNVILVKNGEVDTNSLDIESGYGDLLDWVRRTDFSDPAQWEQLNKEVDVQSFIDFITVNYYLCNFDFDDYKNHVMWRSAYEEASPYADRRWRWCIYDIDPIQFALERYDVENAAEINIFSWELPHTETRVNETIFFRSLRSNPDFNRQFVLSFMDMVNNNFSVDKAAAVLEKNGLTLDWMDGFFEKRPAYAAQHLAEEFALTGTLETVTIESAQPDMGTITVNTSQIDLTDGCWEGRYFTDYPITVTAEAKDGYAFIGWKGDAEGSGNTMTLSVDGGLTLEAVFAKAK